MKRFEPLRRVYLDGEMREKAGSPTTMQRMQRLPNHPTSANPGEGLQACLVHLCPIVVMMVVVLVFVVVAAAVSIAAENEVGQKLPKVCVFVDFTLALHTSFRNNVSPVDGSSPSPPPPSFLLVLECFRCVMMGRSA